jgi:hypothetical protein
MIVQSAIQPRIARIGLSNYEMIWLASPFC